MSLTTTATADGTTSAIHATDEQVNGSQWVANITATTWGASTVATLQQSYDGSTRWSTVKTLNGDVAVSANEGFVVPANLYYRLSVASYSGSAGLQLELF